ncbi:MAG: amidohydrolase family protein, partial [Clostridia bacterium]
MLFKNVTIINSSFKSEPNMYVATTNDKIDYVGNEYISGYGDEFDGSGYLLCPAFYNVHAHSAMTLLRGIGEDLPLSQWLNTKIFPAESTLCGEDVYYGTLLAIAEMLAHGTASCSDMYFFSNYAASAYSEAQFKCNISPNSVCFDENEHFQDSSVFADYEKLLERYAKSPLIRLDATLHSEYATTPRFCAEVAKYALLNKLGMYVHVSETFGEHAQCVATRKKTPTAYFDSLGVFDVRATAAHCVYVTDDDLKILSKKNVSIATNPQSNLKLGSGIADYKSISDTKI